MKLSFYEVCLHLPSRFLFAKTRYLTKSFVGGITYIVPSVLFILNRERKYRPSYA